MPFNRPSPSRFRNTPDLRSAALSYRLRAAWRSPKCFGFVDPEASLYRNLCLQSECDVPAVGQGSILFFRRSRRNRPSFAYGEGLRFDIPAGNAQCRVRSNRVFAREASLDSPFFSRQQREVVIFPEYRQDLFSRLPRFHR